MWWIEDTLSSSIWDEIFGFVPMLFKIKLYHNELYFFYTVYPTKVNIKRYEYSVFPEIIKSLNYITAEEKYLLS